MNVPTMKFKMPQEHLELGVMVEQGFAFGVGDVNGEDAVVVVGLHDTAVVAEECELALRLKLGFNYGSEVAHGDTPLCDCPILDKVLLCLRLRQRPASIEFTVLEAQGFHLGFVEGQGCDKEPQKRKDDGFGKGLVREDASDKEQASDEGDEVFHGGSFS